MTRLAIRLYDTTPHYARWLLLACAAELIGVALVVFIGVGTITATSMLDADFMTPSHLVAIALAFGLGFAVVGSATLPTSGGHLNPAISFAMVVSGRLTLVAGICYTVAQSIGAIVGVFCVSAAFPDEYHGELGATVLSSGVSLRTGFFIELLLTFMLIFVIFGCGVNSKDPQVTAPFSVGSTVAAAHLIGCNLTGGSLNPARSLGSALVANIWHNVWIYWVGPFMGALIAVILIELAMRPSQEFQKVNAFFLTGEDEIDSDIASPKQPRHGVMILQAPDL